MSVAPRMESAPSSKLDEAKRAGGRFSAFNFPLLVVIALLVAYGLLVVWSATQGSSEYSISRQLTGVVVGVAVMIVFWRFDYRKFANLLVPLLIIDVVLMLSPHLPLIGYDVKGAQSWIVLFGQQLQPGEPAKIVTILLMASLVARYRGHIDSGREYLKVIGILMIPFLCIMTQPDLGTGLVILVIGAVILFTGGANRKWLLITLGIGIALIAGVLLLDPILDDMAGEDVFIKDYQMNRLMVFMDEDLDPTGAGYNLKQAKIAIGSGGFTGKGLGNGTQSALGFLPEAPTDFIFCVLAEELGFLGAMGLLALYGALFALVFRVASKSSDLFGTLVVMGITGMWAFQVLENIGMTCGLMPITGIPLPFISYGSSFMVVNFMAVGLICSVWSHRHREVSAVN